MRRESQAKEQLSANQEAALKSKREKEERERAERTLKLQEAEFRQRQRADRRQAQVEQRNLKAVWAGIIVAALIGIASLLVTLLKGP